MHPNLGFLRSGPIDLYIKSLNIITYKTLVSSSTIETKLVDCWDIETIGIRDEEEQDSEYYFEDYRDKHLY